MKPLGSDSHTRKRPKPSESQHRLEHATPPIESQAQPLIQPPSQLQSVQQQQLDAFRHKYANRSKADTRNGATDAATRTAGLQRKN